VRWWWVAGGAVVGVVGLGVIGALVGGDDFDEHLGVAVGDCILGSLPDEYVELDTVACSEPHSGEVFALVRDGAGDAEPFPGAATMMRRGAQGCVDAFPAYTGTTVSRAGLEIMMKYPTPTAWEQEGDRVAICLLRAVDGDLVGSRRGKPPDDPLPPERSLDTLTVGDCFSSERLSAGEAIVAVELSDCAAPHTFEVFGTTDAPNDIDYGEVEAFAERSCNELFDSYVGIPYDSSVLHAYNFRPRLEDWKTAGDRRSFCVAFEPGRDLVGTVRNTNR
jgi:hypothetical protein